MLSLLPTTRWQSLWPPLLNSGEQLGILGGCCERGRQEGRVAPTTTCHLFFVVFNSAAEEAHFLTCTILDFQCFVKEANNNDNDNNDDSPSEWEFPEMKKQTDLTNRK